MMGEDQDFEIVRRCLSGERRAFETVIEKYQGMVLRVAFRIVNNFEDAKDVTQSVFVKAYENLPSFDSQHKLFSWIYRIAVNESLNWTKKRRRESSVPPSPVTAGGDPHDALMDGEVGRKIEKAMAELTAVQRALLALSLDGFSYKEMGGLLELSEKKVKSRLYEARDKIKTFLKKEGLTAHGR